MYVVTWHDERWEVFEEQFENLIEAETFMEDLPCSAQLYYEGDTGVKRII